jgi:hypothetical protein
VAIQSQYKYQALKDFSFMLELEPYIGYGLINLIPDPSNFDQNLMRSAIDMASSRRGTVESRGDKEAHTKLAIEDYLNSIHMLPKDVKVRSLINDFCIPEDLAFQLIDSLEANADASPLTMLQPIKPSDRGQLIQFSMSPNYEMSLFTAQVTGSVIVTDSETRWMEFLAAQHSQKGVVSYPWNDVYGLINRMPMDYQMLELYTKSQYHFAEARTILKQAHELDLSNKHYPFQLRRLSELTAQLNIRLKQIDSDRSADFVNADCKILAPEGGIYDKRVQRLLAQSSYLRYENKVRSVYYVGLKL